MTTAKILEMNRPMKEKLFNFPGEIRAKKAELETARRILKEAQTTLQELEATMIAAIAAEVNPNTGKAAFSNAEARGAELIGRKACLLYTSNGRSKRRKLKYSYRRRAKKRVLPRSRTERAESFRPGARLDRRLHRRTRRREALKGCRHLPALWAHDARGPANEAAGAGLWCVPGRVYLPVG